MKNNIIHYSKLMCLFVFLGMVASCNEDDAIAKQDSSIGVVKYLVQHLETDMLIDKASKEDVSKILEMKISPEYMSRKIEFDSLGYYINQTVSIYDGTLHSLNYDAFYEDLDLINSHSSEIISYLTKKYGTPIKEAIDYTYWENKTFTVNFTKYPTGWGLYILSYREIIYPSPNQTYKNECEGKSGDMNALISSLESVVFDNIKNNKIVFDKSTHKDLEPIFGSSQNYNQNFDGIELMGMVYYTQGKLSSIILNYFYNCNETLIELEQDKVSLRTAIENFLKTKLSGETYEYETKNYVLNVVGFPNGYDITFSSKLNN